MARLLMANPVLVSLALLVASAGVHVSLLILVLDAVAWVLRRVGRWTRRWRQAVVLFAMLGILVASHLAQVWLWAQAMVGLGIFGEHGRAFHASLGYYTSVGPGADAMPPEWHLLGSLEALTGMLMLGLTTGTAFAIVNRLMQARLAQVAPSLLSNLP
jgi:hypothetical protein